MNTDFPIPGPSAISTSPGGLPTGVGGNRRALPSLGEAVSYWWQLGWTSFGGPAAQIAMMHREVVERRRWFSDEHFLHAVNFTMLLPGPEAQQLATYLGWRLHGWRGGLAAGGLFILPSMAVLILLAWLYLEGQSLSWVAAAFRGLQGAVLAAVLLALTRLGRRALAGPGAWGLALAAFIAIYFLQWPFWLILAAGGLLGLARHRFSCAPIASQLSAGHGIAAPNSGGGGLTARSCLTLPVLRRPSFRQSALVLLVGLVVWWAPLVGVGALLGWGSTPAVQGVFFSKAAVVTFGGAYAVLPYVAQQAVETHQWLSPSQMMAGLALAESTPGPLIMVLPWVGFLGGWQQPGALAPWIAATLCFLVTTWATFAPCFLWIFLGGPYVEQLGEIPPVRAALAGITAVVVGVMANLAVIFGQAALLPEPGRLDIPVAVIGVAAAIALIRFRLGLVPILATSAALGLVLNAVGW